MSQWTRQDIERAVEFVWQAHTDKSAFQNLPESIAPRTVDQAYDIQEALHENWIRTLGPIGGLKIATTTKVMQKWMGIDHPCGGAIFQSRIQASPFEVALSNYVHAMAECELALRLRNDIDSIEPISRDEAREATSDVAPAFELVEDRFAKHNATHATSLIADNAWNAGVVHGEWQKHSAGNSLGVVQGALTVDGELFGKGTLDDPFGALSWLAALAARRGRPLRSGMIVITGSIIPTFELSPEREYRFELGSLGEAVLRVRS